ncbi:hypothetical protein CP98_04009 [Sphingobium yanoikuyae]|uniref:Uncharacterized protein n=1 Tax=Sphingobium yanoikuyae TaxID=13690 RepID=A0A084EFE6_SPHYA|nr:hypothetical protein CP98_04009 [Sphingobium yanoikuyae]
MMAHQFDDQRRDILCQRMAKGRVVGDMDLAHAGDLGGFGGNAVDALASNQQMDFAQLGCSGHGGKGRVLDGAALMFNPNERLRHAATPRALSWATSSSTSATLMPAERLGGSETLSVSRRAAMSTP